MNEIGQIAYIYPRYTANTAAFLIATSSDTSVNSLEEAVDAGMTICAPLQIVELLTAVTNKYPKKPKWVDTAYDGISSGIHAGDCDCGISYDFDMQFVQCYISPYES